MTEQERIERAVNAKQALEFLDPAFEVVLEEYHNRLAGICATKPWATSEIAALANATRVVQEVRAQISGLVLDGEDAKAKKTRAQRIEELSPTRRRLLKISPF